MYRFAPALAMLAVTIGLVICPPDDANAESAHVRSPHLRACLSDEGESAFPCAWFAPVMGNGEGHSFRIYRDGRVKQISHKRAFALLGECDSDGPIYC